MTVLSFPNPWGENIWGEKAKGGQGEKGGNPVSLCPCSPVPPRVVPPSLDVVALYLDRLAPRSRRVQGLALAQMARWMGQSNVATWTYPEGMRLRAWLAETYAPATANRMLSAWKGVMREAFLVGLVDADTSRRLELLPPIPGTRLPPGRALTPGEIVLLAGTCRAQEGPIGLRDTALLAVLYTCGLRRSEAVSLQWEDLHGESLRVVGKGNRERALPLAPSTQRVLGAWKAACTSGWVFVVLRKGGHITAQPLSADAVQKSGARWARLSGIPPFTPHDLRRTFITHLLEHGVDLEVVRKLAGHASVQTTARYDRRDASALRDAVETLSFPG